MASAKGMDFATFARMAVVKLRQGKVDGKGVPYRGVHVVYSGFNAAAYKHFNVDKDGLRLLSTAAVKAGKIAVIPCRGGAMMYLAEEAPERTDTRGEDTLAKILG